MRSGSPSRGPWSLSTSAPPSAPAAAERGGGGAGGYGRSAAVVSIGFGATGLVTFAFFALASHALSHSKYGAISLLWASLEPEEGRFTFDWLDEVIEGLWKDGIRFILATPGGGKPNWLALELSSTSAMMTVPRMPATAFGVLISTDSPGFMRALFTESAMAKNRKKRGHGL